MTLQGHFFLKQKGHFSEIERALLCLLQNLGGHVPPQCPLVPMSMFVVSIEDIQKRTTSRFTYLWFISRKLQNTLNFLYFTKNFQVTHKHGFLSLEECPLVSVSSQTTKKRMMSLFTSFLFIFSKLSCKL